MGSEQPPHIPPSEGPGPRRLPLYFRPHDPAEPKRDGRDARREHPPVQDQCGVGAEAVRVLVDVCLDTLASGFFLALDQQLEVDRQRRLVCI